MQQFRLAIDKYAVMKGLDIYFVQNERKRVRIRCKEKYPWKLFVSIDNSNDTFINKTYHRHHNCGRVNGINFTISLLQSNLSLIYMKIKDWGLNTTQ